MSRSGGNMIGSGDAPLSQKIFIGGVGQTSEEDIQKEFSNYGNVSDKYLFVKWIFYPLQMLIIGWFIIFVNREQV